MPLDLSKLEAETIALSSNDAAGRPHDHFVEIYDDDSALIASLARFVNLGVELGEVSIVVATEEHRDQLETKIEGLEAARRQGLYRAFDAADMLEHIMRDGIPRPEMFVREVGNVIDAAARGGRKVRIFGEMVALLWAQGNIAGALALEDLWNRLADQHPFRLFCSYPADAFGESNLAPLQAVCNRHSHVIAAPRN